MLDLSSPLQDKEDSDDGDPTQPLVPSQEQADDIHLIATDSAELQEILVKIQHIGKLHAGFDFQLRKTKQMEVRDTIKAGKTTLPDVLALEHKHARLLCGLPMGERSVHTHTRYCKKRMLENQNYSVLEKQFWTANKNLKRNKCLEKPDFRPKII